MSSQEIYCNGVDPVIGSYSIPPLSQDEFAGYTLGQQKPQNFGVLQARDRRRKEREGETTSLGVKEGIDPANLQEAGWGVIFAQGADPEVEKALSELLKLRQECAGGNYFIFKGEEKKGGGYKAGESANHFLARNGLGPAQPADPQQGMPYYLLLVGSPQEISYEFQTGLGVIYAVGRIYFDDLDGYRNYARTVCDAEEGRLPDADRAAFFGVANPNDSVTKKGVEKLVKPLLAGLTKRDDYPHPWHFNSYIAREDANDEDTWATRANLDCLLGGDTKPGLLFTASHGVDVKWRESDQGKEEKTKRLFGEQGSLICQGWDGPKSGPISRDNYFAADDLPLDRDLRGLIAFFFACFGGGTPLQDQFFLRFMQNQPGNIAPYPFLAGLPQKMISLPAGALAVIGHVERTWDYAFSWPGIAEPQMATFESAMSVLLKHQPVGMAMEYFSQRHAALTVPLFKLKTEIDFGKNYDTGEWISMWTAHSDASSYIILGDPAVRLPLGRADCLPQEEAGAQAAVVA